MKDIPAGLDSLRPVLDALPDLALVIDETRQAAWVNRSMLEWLGKDALEAIVGKSPGSVFGCVHAGEPGGCGAGPACAFCGSNRAVTAALCERRPESGECRLTVVRDGREESLDLRVNAHPLSLGGRHYVLLVVADISDQKRRRVLERLFFHDVINTAGGLSGLLELMAAIDDPAELKRLAGEVSRIGRGLLDEIMAQKDLSQAENGELVPEFSPVDGGEALREAVQLVACHKAVLNRAVAVTAAAPEAGPSFMTDRRLLKRVLVNMLKNAAEASPAGGVVDCAVESAPDGRAVRFLVRNAGAMSDEARHQVFQRSFSTKARNRGLGTYSMKLFAERYLGGRIGFRSDAREGTVFHVELPAGPGTTTDH